MVHSDEMHFLHAAAKDRCVSTEILIFLTFCTATSAAAKCGKQARLNEPLGIQPIEIVVYT